MKDLRFNTIAGTALAAALMALGLRTVGDEVFHPHYPSQPAYAIAVPEEAVASVAEETAVVDIGTLLQTASVDAGANVVKKCTGCHNFEQGGANQVGPYLWDVYGRMAGSVAGFKYSEAVSSYQKVWAAETLNAFLENPTQHIRGTNMAFAGLKKPEDRAAVIAYLHSLNPGAPALPAPAAPPPEAAVEGAAAPSEVAPEEAAPPAASAPPATPSPG